MLLTSPRADCTEEILHIADGSNASERGPASQTRGRPGLTPALGRTGGDPETPAAGHMDGAGGRAGVDEPDLEDAARRPDAIDVVRGGFDGFDRLGQDLGRPCDDPLEFTQALLFRGDRGEARQQA